MKDLADSSLFLYHLRGFKTLFGFFVFFFIFSFSKKLKINTIARNVHVKTFATTENRFTQSEVQCIRRAFYALSKVDILKLKKTVKYMVLTDRGRCVYNPLFKLLMVNIDNCLTMDVDGVHADFKQLIRHLNAKEKGKRGSPQKT